MKFLFALLLLPCLLVSLLAEDESPLAKEFKQYAAKRPLFLVPRVDVDSHPVGKKFRTVIRAAAQPGPNFGGHLVIAQWGCGTGCIQWAVVDLRTGHVFVDDELGTLGWGPGLDEAGVEEFLTFRADSSLLVLHEVTGAERPIAKRHFLRWDGARFERLRSETLPTGPEPR